MTPKSSSRIPARRVPPGRVDTLARPQLKLPSTSSAPLVAPSQARQALVRSRRGPLQAAASPLSQPTTTVRALAVQRRRSRSSQVQLQAWEILCRIGVNLLLTTASISGLYRLLPVQLAQYHRLQVLEQQIEVLGTRISRLQEGIDRGMDPMQQEALIKERLNKVPPNQIRVRLVDPGSFLAEQREATQQTWIGQSSAQSTGILVSPPRRSSE